MDELLRREAAPRRVKRWLCAWLLLVCLQSSRGTALAQDFRYLRHQSWSTEDGLPQNSVSQIVQTSDGFLWIATEGGIARFDGISFKNFSHSNEPAFVTDDVCCLAPGVDGTLWVGTTEGLLLVRAGRFTRYTEASGLPSSSVRALVSQPDGSLLVLTTGGSAVWKNGRFLPPGARELSGSPEPNVSADASGNWSFTETSVTLQGRGISRQWSAGKDLLGSRVETLLVDREGNAWVGTNKGLEVLNSRNGQVVGVPALQGNVVLQVFEDREGNVWIGTETSGLHVLRPSKFRTEPGLADQELTAIVQGSQGPASDVWIGTRREGLRLLRNGVASVPAPAEKLTSPFILSLAPGERGSVWAGTPDGLNHVNPRGAVEQFTSANGLPDDYIQALADDGQNGVWIGTRRGLAHLRGSHVDVFTKADGLAGDLIGSLLQASDGTLWIGTSGGFSRRAPNCRFTTYAPAGGIGQGLVTAIAEDAAHVLWISVGEGALGRLERGRFHRLEHVAGSGQIDGLVADRRGFLWLRNRTGVYRAAIGAIERCLQSEPACVPEVSQYGLADGLPSVEIAQGGAPVLWTMANGELWFATRRGVAITNPEHFTQNLIPPSVVIERFLADEQALAPTNELLQVPVGHVRFTIEYAALSFTVPSEVRYRYKLEGLEENWTDAGARRSATYTNLRPRTYTFRVQAMNNDGVWNQNGATFAFRIVPPFYRRWWFLVLMVLCLAALAVGLYRLRLRSLQLRFDAVLGERNRMAREIHDTLAQDFVGVSLQLDIIAQLLGMRKAEAAAAQVQQTRKLVTEGLAEARRSIWELRANLAQDSLPTQLTRAVERYADGPIKTRLKIGGAYRKLEDRLEAEVLRITQEALSNVERHSGTFEAAVDLNYGSDMLVLTVQDHGKGFVIEDALKTGDRFGLRGMQERAAVAGGHLTIETARGSGTTVTLSSPIPSAEKGKTP